jgi:hypothetical protein
LPYFIDQGEVECVLQDTRLHPRYKRTYSRGIKLLESCTLDVATVHRANELWLGRGVEKDVCMAQRHMKNDGLGLLV